MSLETLLKLNLSKTKDKRFASAKPGTIIKLAHAHSTGYYAVQCLSDDFYNTISNINLQITKTKEEIKATKKILEKNSDYLDLVKKTKLLQDLNSIVKKAAKQLEIDK